MAFQNCQQQLQFMSLNLAGYKTDSIGDILAFSSSRTLTGLQDLSVSPGGRGGGVSAQLHDKGFDV